jgi:hypothetical protein
MTLRKVVDEMEIVAGMSEKQILRCAQNDTGERVMVDYGHLWLRKICARRAALAARGYPTLAAMKLRRRWGTQSCGSARSAKMGTQIVGGAESPGLRIETWGHPEYG